MDYVRLGSTGLKVSRLCLGTMTYGTSEWRDWVLDEKASRPFFERALEAGVNFFDTADMYSRGRSEEVTGRALRDMTRREEVVIATKVFNPMGESPNERGLSRKHIFHAIDASLKRLGTDYVDLYQIHRWDYDTPIEETMEALHEVVRSGKARYIGASSMFAWQFSKALYTAREHGWTPFATMQNIYNLVYREEEREMLPLCRDQCVGVIPWSPLARGFLAGNRPRGSTGETVRARTDEFSKRLNLGQETDYAVLDQVTAVAQKRGVQPAQIALAWVAGRAGVTCPIVGASKMPHLDQAIEAIDLRLDDEEVKALEAPYTPHWIAGHQ